MHRYCAAGAPPEVTVSGAKSERDVAVTTANGGSVVKIKAPLCAANSCIHARVLRLGSLQLEKVWDAWGSQYDASGRVEDLFRPSGALGGGLNFPIVWRDVLLLNVLQP